MTCRYGIFYNQAVTIFVRALELYPRDAEIHFNLGVTLQALGKAQEAARRFTTALEVNPQVLLGFCSGRKHKPRVRALLLEPSPLCALLCVY